MARKVKRWAVRESKAQGGSYWLFIGPKPRKPKGGWHNAPGYWALVGSDYFEHFYPKRYHLKPGGGPVEIRFADEG